MPAALPIHLRTDIVQRRQTGMTFRTIARELQLPYASVRQIWRHWQERGTLQPNYAACRQTGPRKPVAVYQAAIAMKQQHPRWGALLIRLELMKTFAQAVLPAERTLQTWFRQAGVNRRRSSQPAQPPVPRGAAVHAVWAVDAKEKMELGDGSGASWLTITDEASGAILQTAAFPPQQLDSGAGATGTAQPATGFHDLGKAAQNAL